MKQINFYLKLIYGARPIFDKSIPVELRTWHQVCDKALLKLMMILIPPPYIDRLAQDCSNYIANTLKLLQSCTKSSIWATRKWTVVHHIHNTAMKYSMQRNKDIPYLVFLDNLLCVFCEYFGKIEYFKLGFNINLNMTLNTFHKMQQLFAYTQHSPLHCLVKLTWWKKKNMVSISTKHGNWYKLNCHNLLELKYISKWVECN